MRRWKLSQLTRLIGLATIASLVLSAPDSQAEQPTSKQIQVALYADKGATIKSLPEVVTSLPASEGFAVTKIFADEIRDGALDHHDLVIFPGGTGSGEGNALGRTVALAFASSCDTAAATSAFAPGPIWRRLSIHGRSAC